jgi:hypothetical protein
MLQPLSEDRSAILAWSVFCPTDSRQSALSLAQFPFTAVFCLQVAWQPPEEYEAQVRFAPVAAAVRAAVAAGTYTGPLAGKLIVIQCTAGGAAAAAAGGVFSSHAAAAEHRQSLQRLVRALGGRVCGARAAEVRWHLMNVLKCTYYNTHVHLTAQCL